MPSWGFGYHQLRGNNAMSNPTGDALKSANMLGLTPAEYARESSIARQMNEAHADDKVVEAVAEAIRLRDTTDEYAMARAAIAAYQKAVAGGEPCGECHLKPGEVCDICGKVQSSK